MQDDNTRPKVFISYPSAREKQAEILSGFLEAEGFGSWTAYKDIDASKHYSREIVEAINRCDAIVVLVCSEADESEHVERELNEALSKRKPIFPLAVEKITGEDLKHIAYYVNLPQWTYWTSGRSEELNAFADALRKRLSPEAYSPHIEQDTVKPKSSMFTRISLLAACVVIAGTLYALRPNVGTLSSHDALEEDNEDKYSALLSAASNSDPEIMKKLLDAESEATRELLLEGVIRFQWRELFWHSNLQSFNTTLLGIAAINGNAQVVKFLIERGADVNVKSSEGVTALIAAIGLSESPNIALTGSLEAISLLIKAGADVNVQDDMGTSALIEAARADARPEVVELLLKAGAAVNLQDIDGKTALMWAASRPHYHPYSEDSEDYYKQVNYKNEIMLLLLKAGADVNIRDNDGTTALMYAAGSAMDKSASTVRILLEAGADVNVTNTSGETALDFADTDKFPILRTILAPEKR